MPVITVWKWKDLDEEDMVQAMGATALLDYAEGYQDYLFVDGSGGVSIGPDDEGAEARAPRSFVIGKWCILEAHQAMTARDSDL